MHAPILKNNGCHGNRAFFHSAFEFIFDDIFCISGVPVDGFHETVLGDARLVKLSPSVLCIVWHFVCRFCRDVAHIFSAISL